MKYIFGGNWKMQIPDVKTSVKTAIELNELLQKSQIQNSDVFIAPSHNALYEIGKSIADGELKLAGQNMHFMERGAYTGETSVLSLIEAGAEYVILGHSERRRIFGEENNLINKKVLTALDHGLKVVLCIGETAKERQNGMLKEINYTQLEESLKDVSKTQIRNIIIAYEPVWAINNPALNPNVEIRSATVEEANEAHMLVRTWIKANYGKIEAENIKIQYGGSMKITNAKELLAQQHINGGLIGGASLNPETFVKIIKYVE